MALEAFPVILTFSPKVWDIGARLRLGAEWEKLLPKLNAPWGVRVPLVVNSGGIYLMCMRGCAAAAKGSHRQSLCQYAAPTTCGGYELCIEVEEWAPPEFYRVGGPLSTKAKAQLRAWLKKAFPYPFRLPARVPGIGLPWDDVLYLWDEYPRMRSELLQEYLNGCLERAKYAGDFDSLDQDQADYPASYLQKQGRDIRERYRQQFKETLKLYRKRGKGELRRAIYMLAGDRCLHLRCKDTDSIPYILLDPVHYPFGKIESFGEGDFPTPLPPCPPYDWASHGALRHPSPSFRP